MKLLNLLPILGYLLAHPLFAANADPQREIFAVVSAEAIESFRLETRGGKVRIVQSQDDSIHVHVLLSTKIKQNEEAVQSLERIQIIDEVQGSRWAWRTDLNGMEAEWLAKVVEVHYEIAAPPRIAMEIVQRYGDLSIADWDSPVWLDIRWGNISAGCLAGDGSRLDMQFASADIACLGNATVDLTAGKLALASVNRLNLRSKGAEVKIFQAGEVDIQAHVGEYHLKKVTELRGMLTSSQLKIDTLLYQGDLSVSLMIGTEIGLSETAEKLALTADLASVTVHYPKGKLVSLDLEARRNDLVSIEIPDLPREESLPNEKVRFRSDYASARSAEPTLELLIQSKRGKVNILQR